VKALTNYSGILQPFLPFPAERASGATERIGRRLGAVFSVWDYRDLGAVKDQKHE
jgi:hypothetical protein